MGPEKIVGSEQQVHSSFDVIQAKAGTLRFGSGGMVEGVIYLERDKLLPGAGSCDIYADDDPDLADGPVQPVLNGILHQRLVQERRDGVLLQLIGAGDLQLQPVPEAYLFDIEIQYNIIQLLLYGVPLLLVDIDGIAVILGQVDDHIAGLFLIELYQRVDGIKRVEQEMRVDLLAELIQLGILVIAFINDLRLTFSGLELGGFESIVQYGQQVGCNAYQEYPDLEILVVPVQVQAVVAELVYIERGQGQEKTGDDVQQQEAGNSALGGADPLLYKIAPAEYEKHEKQCQQGVPFQISAPDIQMPLYLVISHCYTESKQGVNNEFIYPGVLHCCLKVFNINASHYDLAS